MAKFVLDDNDREFVDNIVDKYVGRVDVVAPDLKEKMGAAWDMVLTYERARLRGQAINALMARALAEGMRELGFRPTGSMGLSGDASWEDIRRQLYYSLEEGFLPEPPMTFYQAEIFFSFKERKLSTDESDRLSEAVFKLGEEMVIERILEEDPRAVLV